MKKLIAGVVLVLAFFSARAVADSYPDGPNGIRIAIIDTSTALPPAKLGKYLPEIQTYADQVCEAWHCKATLYVGSPREKTDWRIAVRDWTDTLYAIAYHTEKKGIPVALVGIQAALSSGMPWGVAFTHELGEMLVDPTATLAANTNVYCDQFSGSCSNATFYSYEIADPVQGEYYKIGKLTVSDFVYRSWFQKDAKGPYDVGRHLNSPLSMAPESYMGIYKDGSWKSVDTFKEMKQWDRFFPEHCVCK